MSPATTIRITLTAGDRDRLGAPEVLDYDWDVLMLGEAEQIQTHGGLSPVDWVKEMVAKGWLPLLASERTSLPPEQVALALQVERAVVWMALRRAGIDIPYSEVDYNRQGMKVAFPEAPQASGDGQGKDPSTPPEPSPGDASS